MPDAPLSPRFEEHFRRMESGKFGHKCPDLDQEYDEYADALGSYNAAMKAIGDQVKETGVVPDCLLGNGKFTEQLLRERGQSYGSFADNGRIAQHFKDFFRRQSGWDALSCVKQEALDMIASKLARILSSERGNEYADSWRDLCGYAALALREIEGDPL